MLTKEQAKELKIDLMLHGTNITYRNIIDRFTEPDPQPEPKLKVGDMVHGVEGIGKVKDIQLDEGFFPKEYKYLIEFNMSLSRRYDRECTLQKVIHFQPSGKKFEDLVMGDKVYKNGLAICICFNTIRNNEQKVYNILSEKEEYLSESEITIP